MTVPPWILAALPPGAEVGADGKLVLGKSQLLKKTEQLPPCETCKYNIGNRCQNLDQSCPPCKQGIGLDSARKMSNFKCPLNLKKSQP
jgi:hypothetical protein